MIVRFQCPSCEKTHTFDMPETEIHMTCSVCHKAIKIYVTKGGDPRASVAGEEVEADAGD